MKSARVVFMFAMLLKWLLHRRISSLVLNVLVKIIQYYNRKILIKFIIRRFLSQAEVDIKQNIIDSTLTET